MEASNYPSESDPKQIVPRNRSRWSISLGGVLIFAAGMMVGFAPMRAWIFFRDEPKQILIEAVLFETLDSDAANVRAAFAESDMSDASRGLDPMQILQSRARTHVALSQPTIMTMLDREARFQVGGEYVASAANSASSVVRFVGVDASFTPRIRPSGRLELEYRLRHSSARKPGVSDPAVLDDTTIESSAVIDGGVWRLIEMGKPTGEHVLAERSRWLLLRATPMDAGS